MAEPAQLSTFEVFHFLVKNGLGAGSIFLPIAFHCVGILGGVFLITIFTILHNYGVYIMVQCMFEASSKVETSANMMTMSETVSYAVQRSLGSATWGTYLAYLVDFLLVFLHFAFGAMYLILIAETLRGVAFFDIQEVSPWISLVIVGIFCGLLLLAVSEDRLPMLPLNITGNIQMIFAFVFVLCNENSLNLLGLIYGNTAIPLLRIDAVLFVGFAMFSLNSVGAVVTIVRKLSSPERFLNLSGVFCCSSIFIFFTNLIWTLYILLNMNESSPYIPFTENLNFLPTYGRTAKLCLSAAFILTYPVNAYVPLDIICHQYINNIYNLKNPKFIEMILRGIFLILNVFIVACVPLFMPIVKIITSIALPTLSLIIPGCIRICLGSWRSCSILLHIFIQLIGIVVMACGLYSGYYDVTVYYMNKPIKYDLWLRGVDELV